MLLSEHLQITVETRDQGGQQAGLPNPRVRVEHLPTRTVAVCEMSRSQFRNKRIACEMIEWALSEMGWSEAPATASETRRDLLSGPLRTQPQNEHAAQKRKTL